MQSGNGVRALRAFLLVSAIVLPCGAVAAEERDGSDERGLGADGQPIVVTGHALADPEKIATLPVVVLSGDELVHRRGGTIGETLDGLPGVHMDNFGAGASRPVIRGQTIPRIAILNNGADVFDASSASPDHAVVTDPLLLNAIEIQRGPAAIAYGGNAVNGAVNLIDGKIPTQLPAGGLAGSSELRFGRADDEIGGATRVTAGVGQFAVHAEGSFSDRDDYDVPDGYGSDRLRDSFANAHSYAFGASWITGKGYVGLAYTRQEAEYGLPGHSHVNAVCHTHGLDLHCAAHGGYGDPFGSPDDHTAYIDLQSERVDLRAGYTELLPGIEHVRLRGSYTDYAHDEIDGPSLFTRYTNEVWDGRLEFTHKPILGFTGTLGVQYTDGTFTGININDMHKPFTQNGYGFDGSPDYHTENVGLFLSERRRFGPIDLEFALRKDWREISVTPPPFRITLSPQYEALFAGWYGAEWRQVLEDEYVDWFNERNPGAKHDPLSASIGATWNIANGYSLAVSLGHTERAPSVRELYARGNNLATNSYELGLASSNPILEEEGLDAEDVLETSDAINLTFRKNGGPLEFEVGVFHQDIDDYVFARLIEIEAEAGIPHNFLIYTAADASFTGIDGQMSYRFSQNSRVTVFGDYVDTNLKTENDNLPRISPGRLGARYDWGRGPLSANVEYYHTFKQDKVALYETPTEGYGMLNATIAYRFAIESGSELELYARGTNLTDELAFVHTSFVKNQSPLRGRNVVFGLRHSF